MSRGPLALSPEVDAFRRAFEQISTDGDALVSALTDEQFFWRPDPATWSVANCIDHLNVVARLYLPRLDEAIADAIRRGLYAEGPFSYAWIGRLMVTSMEPPPRFKMKTPKAFVPPPQRPRNELMAAFRAYQVQFIDRLRQASGLDLAKAKVSSPVAAWLRFSLGSGFALIIAHERRHLHQAKKVTEHLRFPRVHDGPLDLGPSAGVGGGEG